MEPSLNDIFLSTLSDIEKSCYMQRSFQADEHQSIFIHWLMINSLEHLNNTIHSQSSNYSERYENAIIILNEGTFLKLTSGSTAENTCLGNIEYESINSDFDQMKVLPMIRIDDSNIYNSQYIHLRTEKSTHTRPGFRKLSLECFPTKVDTPNQQWFNYIIGSALKNVYLSSEIFASHFHETYFEPDSKEIHGPATKISMESLPSDIDTLICFHVKSWPEEANGWYNRHTKWPNIQTKLELKLKGFLLVPVGHKSSPEKHLEWRCSFSIAEKIIFCSLTEVQLLTFIVFKILGKEISDFAKDQKGDSILSTYHFKTVFLWYLEKDDIIWEPRYMFWHIKSMVEMLYSWIERENSPHYFVEGCNLLEGKFNDSPEKKLQLLKLLSDIKRNLWNKLDSSKQFSVYIPSLENAQLFFVQGYNNLFSETSVDRSVPYSLNKVSYFNLENEHVVFNWFDKLSNNIITFQTKADPHMIRLYKTLYSEPVCERYFNLVRLQIIQYCESVKLAKYCRNKRECIKPTYKLKEITMNLLETVVTDPCTGYIKLACLYINTKDYKTAQKYLNKARNNFFTYKDRVHKFSASLASSDSIPSISTITSDIMSSLDNEILDGKIILEITFYLLEYNILPTLLQYELINEMSFQTEHLNIKCHLSWNPIVILHFLEYICLHYLESDIKQINISLQNLVTSALQLPVGDMYTVFNITAWCYVNVKEYKEASHMCIVAIQNSTKYIWPYTCYIGGDNWNRFKSYTFSQQFVSYIIKHCM